jgi:D-sedoheptulose 7-phosphate isomerase
MKKVIAELFGAAIESISAARDHLAEPIGQAAAAMADAIRAGGCVFVFGNGGSAADAQHLAAELVGRFRRERPAFAAEALTTDTSAITAIANDYGFDAIFARQLEGKARPGDVAIGITTSGNSPNVVAAMEKARAMGLATIAMTGTGGGKCKALADVLLDVPCDVTAHVQEAHLVIYHSLCELVESALAD